MYLNIFMCLHIVGLLVIYVLPRFVRGERSQQASNASTNEKPVAEISTTMTTVAATAAATTRPQLITKENGGAQSIALPMANGHHQKIAATKPVATTPVLNTNNMAHNTEQFVDTIPINRNQCDTNVNNTETRLNAGVISGGGNGGSSVNTASSATASATVVASSSNHLSNITNNDGTNNGSISSNNNDRHLSKKIRERIDSETRLIEDKLLSSFDKTVTGIVELKDDLMRVNQDEMYASTGMKLITDDDGLRKRNLTEMTNSKEIETFLRKEMNNANVKVVLGNSQAD